MSLLDLSDVKQTNGATRKIMTQVQQSLLFETYDWKPGELHVFRKREKLTVSQWAEKNIVLTMSARPGPWRNSVTPYLVEIMDTWGLPWVREVVVCAAVQTGKTSAEYNCMGYAIDRTPGPTMIIMPDEKLAKEVSQDRIRPMIEASPCLQKLMSINPDDTARFRIKFLTGMIIYLAWASSPSGVSSKPIEYLFFDEIDKFPKFSGKKQSKEADPISLGEARTTTFAPTRKIFKTSTPVTERDFVWPALNACQEVRDYHVPCPACGVFQVMKFEQFRWPEEVEAKRIKSKYLAHYECEHCHAQWDDAMRDKAVRAGYWEAREQAEERAQSVGFHLPAYYSPFVSLSEIVAMHLDAEAAAKIGDKTKLQHFFNSVKAEPYIDITVERKEDTILALKDDRPRGLVPSDISCILATVDTQKRGFYYEIRAWGFGLELESWQIREGYVETFDALLKVLFEDEYKDASGVSHIVQYAIMDSGGTVSDDDVTRTAQVYDFCRRYRNIIPLKGRDRMTKTHNVTQIDHFPGTNKAIEGGLKLYVVNVTYFKDMLSNKLQIAPADPGAWHLHKDVKEDYARQMCAEYKDEKGKWQCPRGKANHYWDLGVYGLGLAIITGVNFLKRPEPAAKKKPSKKQPPKRGRAW